MDPGPNVPTHRRGEYLWPPLQSKETIVSLGLTNLRTAVPRSRAEELAASLEERIRTNRLAPGDLVGTLDQLRAETGFARSTISEAVRLLRERGLLEIRPGRGGGLFVTHPSPVIRLRHTLLSVGDGGASVRDAIELREALEEFISLSAARYREESDVPALRAVLAEMKASLGDWTAFMQANWKLHDLIAGITPNDMAGAVYKATLGYLTHTSSSRIDDASAGETSYRLQRYQVHEDLVEAIVAGDEAAVRHAVERHNATT